MDWLMSATVSAGRGWTAPGRRNIGQLRNAARRHSRLVRRLRYGLPLTLVLAVGSYILATWLNPWGALANLPALSGKVVVSGSTITMDLPKVAGYTPDGRAYEMTARAASQDLKRPQFIELKEIRAKVDLADQNRVDVSAASGIYDTKAELVALRENVTAVSSAGMEVRLREAVMDIRKGTILSEKPVEVLMANGRLNAQNVEVLQAGGLINFRGGVTMVMQPPQRAAAEASGSSR
jgi:lipopolysaccharide export system protein LptC